MNMLNHLVNDVEHAKDKLFRYVDKNKERLILDFKEKFNLESANVNIICKNGEVHFKYIVSGEFKSHDIVFIDNQFIEL